MKKTLAILYRGAIEFEILRAIELLGDRYPVSLATPDGADHKSLKGPTYKADLAYSEVNPDEYAAILVPGGDPGSVIGNTHLRRILNKAHANGATLGAICAGPLLLADAGILQGRRIAHGYGPEQLEFLKDVFSDVILTDASLQIDGNLITAKPAAYDEFAQCLAERVGITHGPKAPIDAMIHTKASGQCYCGEIRFEIGFPTEFVCHCHCEDCRATHAAPFVTWTGVPLGQFRFTQGGEKLRGHESHPGIRWGFCGRCGTSFYYESDEAPDKVYLTAASFSSPLDKAPACHVSYEERLPWIRIRDGLPKFHAKTNQRIE